MCTCQTLFLSCLISLTPREIECMCVNCPVSLLPGDGDGQISAAKAVKIMELLAEARAIATKASTGHRELHSTVSKVGKAIDKVSSWTTSSM